jgi:hypothetical protein
VERARESFLIGAASAAPRSIDHYRIPVPPPVLWLLHATITLKLEDRRYAQMAAKVFHRLFFHRIDPAVPAAKLSRFAAGRVDPVERVQGTGEQRSGG